MTCTEIDTCELKRTSEDYIFFCLTYPKECRGYKKKHPEPEKLPREWNKKRSH